MTSSKYLKRVDVFSFSSLVRGVFAKISDENKRQNKKLNHFGTVKLFIKKNDRLNKGLNLEVFNFKTSKKIESLRIIFSVSNGSSSGKL